MVGSVDPSRLGAIEFVQTAAQQRAITYRERAAHLSAMAAAEPIGSLRANLEQLAARYKDLADSMDGSAGRT